MNLLLPDEIFKKTNKAFINQDIKQLDYKQLDFFLISLFNLNIPDFRKRAGIFTKEDYEQWLSKRIDLLIEYTLKSVVKQHIKPFSWLILFDININEKIQKLLNKLSRYEFIIPTFVDCSRGNHNI